MTKSRLNLESGGKEKSYAADDDTPVITESMLIADSYIGNVLRGNARLDEKDAYHSDAEETYVSNNENGHED